MIHQTYHLLVPKGKRKLTVRFYVFLVLVSLSNHVLDPLSKLLNGHKKDIVIRGRDVVANSIMAELAKDDPLGTIEYQDAIRHQVVTIFQHLRLHLLLLDTLMEAFNASK